MCGHAGSPAFRAKPVSSKPAQLHIHFGSPARATRSVAETCNARARGAQASGLGPCTLAGMRNVHMLPYIKISLRAQYACYAHPNNAHRGRGGKKTGTGNPEPDLGTEVPTCACKGRARPAAARDLGRRAGPSPNLPASQEILKQGQSPVITASIDGPPEREERRIPGRRGGGGCGPSRSRWRRPPGSPNPTTVEVAEPRIRPCLA